MANSKSSSSTALFFVIILLSVFAGLVLSIWSSINKKKGKGYILLFILSIICIGFFGFFGYGFFKTSTPEVDAGYYYFGIVSLISNGLAFIILLFSLFSKPNY